MFQLNQKIVSCKSTIRIPSSYYDLNDLYIQKFKIIYLYNLVKHNYQCANYLSLGLHVKTHCFCCMMPAMLDPEKLMFNIILA